MGIGWDGNQWVDDEGKPIKTTTTFFKIEIKDARGNLVGGLSAEDPNGIQTGIDEETGLPIINAKKVESYGFSGPASVKKEGRLRGFVGRVLRRGKEG